MKNVYANQLRATKTNAYNDGVWDGMRMGLNLCAIALNHACGFGETRIRRVEAKVQELVNEIVVMNDPMVTKDHIEKALKQIRGEHWEE